ncbi:MAG: hypothetical protein EB037_04355 [Actinobacteria bacterium]|nr:hypothetical protein [Actinomycetota bacterium]
MGALMVKLNGPRYWTLDGFGTKVAVVEPVSVRTLDEELIVDTTGHVATVIQDELENTYTLP